MTRLPSSLPDVAGEEKQIQRQNYSANGGRKKREQREPDERKRLQMTPRASANGDGLAPSALGQRIAAFIAQDTENKAGLGPLLSLGRAQREKIWATMQSGTK